MRENKLNILVKRIACLLLASSLLLTFNPVGVLAAQVDDQSQVGTYTGTGSGYRGDIKVELDIIEYQSNKIIREIRVTENNETTSYWQKIEEQGFLQKIKESNGTDGIDTVSEATASSSGVIEAVNNAIAKSKGISQDEIDLETMNISTIFDGGDGTKEDPYKINSKETFLKFAKSVETVDNQSVQNSYKDLHVILNTDVDLDGEWDPIGSLKYPFKGTFNGNGHTISGLKIGSPQSPAAKTYDADGLFASLEDGAYVHDLNIIDIYINAIGNQSYYVGGLAGTAKDSVIDNVNVSGQISGATSHNKANIFVGGIVGNGLRQEIYNSSANVELKSVAKGGIAEAGGIIALTNRGVIANSHTSGTINGNTDRALEGMTAFGGIAGVNAGTIVNTYSDMNLISDTYTRYIGAISGWVTGIADTFQSYYDPNATQIIDNATGDIHIISPALAIGWAVGPGVSEDNIPYLGSVSLEVESASPTQAVDKLNNNISKLYVDIENGGRQEGHWTPKQGLMELNSWEIDNQGKVNLKDERVNPVYDTRTDNRIKALLPDISDKLNEGSFYGRSNDKSIFLKLDVDQNGSIKNVKILQGNVDTLTLNKIIDGDLRVGDLGAGPLKEALEDASKRSRNLDYTGYEITDPSAIFADGNGSQTDPYIINNEDQLRAFVASINADQAYEGIYIRLNNNINLTKAWMPAGSGGKWAFKGNFDGGNHAISNMKIGSPNKPYRGSYVGLFTHLVGGEIKNLELKDYDIYAQGFGKDRVFVGPLVSDIRDGARIDNIKTNGKINSKTNSGHNYATGLIAQANKSTVTNVETNVDINVESESNWVYGAGIVGLSNRALVANSSAQGRITGQSSLNRLSLGGLAGWNAGVLYNSYADVNLNSLSPTKDLGYLIGRNTGLGFAYDNYYNPQATINLRGQALDQVDPVGTIVSPGTDVRGEVVDNQGLAYEDAMVRLEANRTDPNKISRVNNAIASVFKIVNIRTDISDLGLSSKVTYLI